MAYKNFKQLLVAGTNLPAKIEEALPEGAPKISTMLVDAANKIPEGPGFPVEIPDLPPLPEFPAAGEGLPGLGLGKKYVREVEITPTGATRVIETRRLGTEILS